MKKSYFYLFSTFFFLISCSTTKDVNLSMTENDKDYEEVIIKIPKGDTFRERYIPKEGEKVYSYETVVHKGKFNLDPDTMQPANGIYKEYYKNGKISLEGRLIDGLLIGKVYVYHENGYLAEFRQFIKEKRSLDGLSVYYNRYNGKPSTIIFNDAKEGYRRSLIRFNIEGKVIDENY